MECPEAVGRHRGRRAAWRVDTETGTSRISTRAATFTAEPFPPFIAEIIEAGGLVERTKQRFAQTTDAE